MRSTRDAGAASWDDTRCPVTAAVSPQHAMGVASTVADNAASTRFVHCGDKWCGHGNRQNVSVRRVHSQRCTMRGGERSGNKRLASAYEVVADKAQGPNVNSASCTQQAAADTDTMLSSLPPCSFSAPNSLVSAFLPVAVSGDRELDVGAAL